MAKILMVTYPIQPPWNEGSKNTAWQIASGVVHHVFCLLTTRQEIKLPNSNTITWERIYIDGESRRKQQLRLFCFLLLTKHDVDVFHFLFVPTLLTSFILSIIVKLKRKKSIQTVPSLYKSKILSNVAKHLFFADRVVTLSDQTTEAVKNLGVENVVEIKSGINLNRFSGTENKSATRKELGLPNEKVLALFSGELSRLGSLRIMLNVTKLVIAKNSNLHIVFASPTRLPKDVDARIEAQNFVSHKGLEKSVTFLGDIDDFSSVLKACDIFLFPVSSMTGKIDTPLTILEAMACAIPIVVTDLPPLNELLVTRSGFLIPVGDDDEFAKAIQLLVNNKELRESMGFAGRSFVKSNHNVKQMIAAYKDLYDEFND